MTDAIVREAALTIVVEIIKERSMSSHRTMDEWEKFVEKTISSAVAECLKKRSRRESWTQIDDMLMSIKNKALRTRIANALKNEGIETIQQINDYRPYPDSKQFCGEYPDVRGISALLYVPGLGRKAYKELQYALEKYYQPVT